MDSIENFIQLQNSNCQDKTIQNNQRKRKVYVVGIAGGTSSGKSSIAKKLKELFGNNTNNNTNNNVVVVSQDSFYKTPDRENFDPSTYNFDHPDAFDSDLMISFLISIKNREGFNIPIYDYINHRRSDKTQYIPEADIVIFEGILALHFQDVYNLFDMKLFVEVDDDIRLSRRIKRDMKERGREVLGILSQYESTVKKSHDEFVEPSSKRADLKIPKGAENFIAISTIFTYIKLYTSYTNKNNNNN